MRTLASILAAMAVVGASPASAYEWKRAADGVPVRLRDAEVVFRLPAHLPRGLARAEVEAAIGVALEAWARAAGVRYRLEPGDGDATLGYQSDRSNHKDIVFVERDWPYDDGALGVALLAIDPATHTIVDADIALNAAQHRFQVLAPDSRGGIYDDLQGAIAHELGHAFGLEHSAERRAVMYPSAERGDTSKRHLSSDDLQGVEALYALPDGPGAAGCSAGGAPSSAGALDAIALGLLALMRARGGGLPTLRSRASRPQSRTLAHRS